MRRDGELVPCTWDEALDDIAARLAALVDEHGPEVVADYTGTGGPLDPSGYALAEGFMRNLGSHQRYSALSIDCPAKFLVPQLMAGVQLQFQPDLEHAELLLAIGVNTVVSHGHGVMVPNPLGHLRDVRARGGRLVVIDPRRSESARHADLHLAPRPGTDPFILAYLVREALRRGGDGEFLAACADEASVRRLAEAVAPYDLETAAAIAGVPVDDLEALDALVAGAARVAIETGTGVTMNRHANLTEWMVWALVAVTGSLDRPRRGHVQPRLAAALRGRRAGRSRRPRPPPGEPARPAPPRERRDAVRGAGRRDPRRAGPGAASCGSATRRWRSPASRRCATRSAELDLLVAIDVRPTETTALATHVLPMTDHFERGDLLSGYLQAEPFLRYAPPVVDAVGRAPPAVVGVRRAGPPPGPADVTAAPAATPRSRGRRGRRRGDRRVADGQRPPAVGRGAGRAVRHP